MIKGIIFDIKRFSINDGPGIRTTVFFKGCPMRCAWCHNPESQKRAPQKAGDRGIIGEVKTFEEILREIEKETIFHDQSGGGVTFSGGEPLAQPKLLGALLDECRRMGIHTTVDTSGCVPPKIFNSIIGKPDLFLYDLKIMDDRNHVKFTGASNRNVMKNLRALSKKRKNVIIRFPVIPGITDSGENIRAVCRFVSSLKFRRIDLLPYHRTAEAKYRRLGMKNRMKGVKTPSDERMSGIKKLFQKYGKKMIVSVS